MVEQVILQQEIIEEQEHFTEAPITIIASPQRQGKSTTAVGRVVEDALAHIEGLEPPPYDGRVIKVRALDKEDLVTIQNDEGKIAKYVKGTNDVKYSTDIVKTLDNPPKIFRIQPTDDNLRPTAVEQGGRYPIIIPSRKVNIYTNFHLFGIQYYYCTMAQILERLHHGTMHDGWLIIDQAEIWIGNRYGSTNLSKVLIDYSHQMGKRHLKTILIYPHLHVADWIQKYQRTETINCSYNKKTRRVTLEIIKAGEDGLVVYDYDGDVYWRFFKTDENFKLPDNRVYKAIAQAF